MTSGTEHLSLPPRPRMALGGIFVRRESWGFSLLGKFLLALALAVLAIGCGLGLYSFLAVTDPVPTEILVVDGWLPTYLLERAAAEFARGHYSQVLAVREADESELSELDASRSDYVVEILVRHGIPQNRLASVLFPPVQKDRTFYSALAIQEWFRQHGKTLTSLNVVTVGPHARRSRLLYRKALGNHVRIGIIGLDDPAYDGRRWWTSSEGMREVLFEGMAYLYVRLVFSPSTYENVQLLHQSY